MNINGINKNRAAITEFNGLKIRNNAGASDFVDMQNIDSHEYPYFSTRRKNYTLNNGNPLKPDTSVTANCKVLGYVAYDTDLYMILKYTVLTESRIVLSVLSTDGNVVAKKNLTDLVADNNKKMVVMGGDIIIYPDWIKYNIKDNKIIDLKKKIEFDITAIDSTTKNIWVYMSTENGDEYAPHENSSTTDYTTLKEYGALTSSSTGYYHTGEAQTSAKGAGRYYFEFKGEGDTKEGKIYKYYNSTSMWMPEDDYVTIGIHYKLFGYDTLAECKEGFAAKEIELNKEINLPMKITGISSFFGGKLNGDVNLFKVLIDGNLVKLIFKGLNIWNTNFITQYNAESNRYIVGQDSWIDAALNPTILAMQIKNELYLDLDYIVSEGNRLFACSSNNHEIYASKLGDPSIWKQFIGVSTDSYAATVGSPGKFTGAAVFNNTPIFFKENCIHRVTGNTPSSYNISYDYYDGILDGCDKSVKRVGNYLIYYSKGGFVYYTGNQPERIDLSLGDKRYKKVIAGEKEGHYIAIGIDIDTNKAYMLDYDMTMNQWYKHSCENVQAMVNVSNDLFLIKNTGTSQSWIAVIEGFGRNLNKMLQVSSEGDFSWYAESGWLIKESINKKYISKLLFKMHLDPLADIRIYFKYDYNNEWELVKSYSNTDDYPETLSLPLIPQRCESMQYKIEGKGKVLIYSITYDISEGSEL